MTRVERSGHSLRLARREVIASGPPDLDASQQQVVDLGTGSGGVLVLGAPGTGKTTTLIEAVVARVERDGLDPGRVLVLAPSRSAAASLRDRVTARLSATVTEPLARTAASYAFGLLRRARVRAGVEAPRLISGPEQDLVLADLLAGHASGEGVDPGWPDAVRPALGLRGFRDELRDLLMRAMERGLTPDDLERMGRRHARPEWAAAAQIYREYLDVTAVSSPGAFDPAAIVDAAAVLLDDDELRAAERERWQLVAVDDHHESGEAMARLLDHFAGPGRDLLLTGDPDATTQGFRGADPTLVAGVQDRYDARLLVLGTRWRTGDDRALGDVTRRVAEGIGSVGLVEHRGRPVASTSVQDDKDLGRGRAVTTAVVRSHAALGAYVAWTLREAHLIDGLPWHRMAVVVRGAGQTVHLRRALLSAGVPLSSPSAEVPVRDEPAVRPLRWAARAALDADWLDPAAAVALVTSPMGGADALALRRLRQALLVEERSGGGGRASDELLVEALGDPMRLATLPDRAAEPGLRVARVLAAGRAAAAVDGASAETVLWAVWDATGLADEWRRRALAGGTSGRRADRDLDAVVALFEAAARFTDRMPGAGPRAFLDQVEAQDVPADTLAERAPQDDVVSLVTPQGAAGREWDLVVVTGLQDGSWPNTRLRGSLLGAPDLVDVVAGRTTDDGAQVSAPAIPERLRAARAAVLFDELRMLHVAVSRAKLRLVACAVSNADERPSDALDLIDPRNGDDVRPITTVPRAVSLPAVVAQLRRELITDGSDGARGPLAARHLAVLAAEGVPGADPDDWYGLPPLSDDGPLRADGETVTVSPSTIESFEQCGLHWLLRSSGGTAGQAAAAGVGSLVHDVAQRLPDGTEAELVALVDELWPSLGLPGGWSTERQRARAHQMVRLLAAYTKELSRRLVGAEVAFEVRVGSAVLRGRVDRLEVDADGRLWVIDLKTGSTPPAEKDMPRHAQLGAYQVAVEAGAFDEAAPPTKGAEGDDGVTPRGGGALIVQLGGRRAGYGLRVQPAVASDPEPAWAHDLVARTAEGMSGSVFVARVQESCNYCPVRSSCPAQAEGRVVGR